MQEEKKKIYVYAELAYVAALLILSLAVSMLAAANFGVSMVVAPAYILSLRVDFLTFGQAEYILQGLVFTIMCFVTRKIRYTYFFSVAICAIYGVILDFWRGAIPLFNPQITPPGSFAMPLRITFFVCGMLMTAFAVALFFKVYLHPQVYDFFVKRVSRHFGFELAKFKLIYDGCSLLVASLMTLLFFGSFRGIGVGTLIMTLLNGHIIRFLGKYMDKHVVFISHWENLEKQFQD